MNTFRQSRVGSAKFIALLVVLAAGCIALAVWRPWSKSDSSKAAQPTPKPSPNSTPTTQISLPSEPKDRKATDPDPVPPDEFIKAYPVGRHVHSVAFVDITGEGENKLWILKGKKHFAYQYRVVAEMTVNANNGTRLRGTFNFKDVHQERAVSERTLSLELPSSPILKLVWEEVDNALSEIPAYAIAKKATEILDPNLERTLSAIGGHTFLIPDKDDEITAVFDKIAGTSVEIEYISGIGVTDIKVLNGKALPHDDLERLAYDIGIVADYFIGTVADAKVNEVKSINVQDLVGMLVLGYDVTPRGTLKFAKTKETEGPRGKEIELEVRGGEVTIAGEYAGEKQTGRILPMSGTVHYLPDQRLVRQAKIEWEAGVDWVSNDSLLFGTTGAENVKMSTYYEAERLDQPAATGNTKP